MGNEQRRLGRWVWEMLLQEGDDDDSNFRGGANLKQWWWAHLKLHELWISEHHFLFPTLILGFLDEAGTHCYSAQGVES